MPTKNPRLNITINKAEAQLLAMLAKQQQKSVSFIAKELILDALERHEDMGLSVLATGREEEAEKKSAKKILHQDVWK